MTFEQLIEIVRKWQSTMTPEQARAATEELAARTTIGLGNLIVEALDAEALRSFAAGGKPAEQADANPVAFVRRPVPQPCKPKPRTKAMCAPAPPPVIDAVLSAPVLTEVVASPPEPSPPAVKPAKAGRPKVAARARKVLRQQLANGPRSESQIEAAAEAAEIPERILIAAADALGLVTKKGE